MVSPLQKHAQEQSALEVASLQQQLAGSPAVGAVPASPTAGSARVPAIAGSVEALSVVCAALQRDVAQIKAETAPQQGRAAAEALGLSQRVAAAELQQQRMAPVLEAALRRLDAAEAGIALVQDGLIAGALCFLFCSIVSI